MVQPASTFPYRRILNYWTKGVWSMHGFGGGSCSCSDRSFAATLFANPVLKQVLLSSGNIPVDRKSKDNQILFRGTFEALAKNEAVALFPEGTSYTEPSIMQVKDGAAWAALEYMKWAKQNPEKVRTGDITVVTAAIVYTNKSKYRSNVRGPHLEFVFSTSVSDMVDSFRSSLSAPQFLQNSPFLSHNPS